MDQVIPSELLIYIVDIAIENKICGVLHPMAIVSPTVSKYINRKREFIYSAFTSKEVIELHIFHSKLFRLKSYLPCGTLHNYNIIKLYCESELVTELKLEYNLGELIDAKINNKTVLCDEISSPASLALHSTHCDIQLFNLLIDVLAIAQSRKE